MVTTEQFWSRKQKSDSHDIQDWLLARNRIGQQFSYFTPPPQRSGGTGPASLPQPPSPPHQVSCRARRSTLLLTGDLQEDDSGFESLVTNVSDSGSLSSRLVPCLSPAQPQPTYQATTHTRAGGNALIF